MVSYDFRCTECAEIFEESVDYESRHNVTCPLCGVPSAEVVWLKSQTPVLFREDNYQVEFGNREGVHCTSKRGLLDAIKRSNENNPNPIEYASEYYG